MGLDDTVNLERIATALVRLAAAFDQYNILYRARLKLEFPPEKAKRAPEVIATESERREQYSDQPSDQWMRDTQAALDNQEPSRFQKRFNQAGNSDRPAAPLRRRVAEVPEVH